MKIEIHINDDADIQVQQRSDPTGEAASVPSATVLSPPQLPRAGLMERGVDAGRAPSGMAEDFPGTAPGPARQAARTVAGATDAGPAPTAADLGMPGVSIIPVPPLAAPDQRTVVALPDGSAASAGTAPDLFPPAGESE